MTGNNDHQTEINKEIQGIRDSDFGKIARNDPDSNPDQRKMDNGTKDNPGHHPGSPKRKK